MTSARRAACLIIALLFAGGTLAACAPEPTPSPAPTPTTLSPSPTAEQTTPPPTTPADPPSTPAPETPSAFTPSELVQICIDVTSSAYAPGVEFDTAGARIEKRTVTPEWLVLVPARTNGYDGESACTIGGSPSDPDIGLASGSIQPLPEEQIQNIIRGENEGGTE